MPIEVVKPPKKFRDICDLIRDGQAEQGLEKLGAYNALEHQKWAVLAEVAYFGGDFETALDYDKQLCPFWGEWHYANVRGEHVAAMAFAAEQLGRQSEYVSFFEQQAALAEAEADIAAHLKNAKVAVYKNAVQRLQSGVVPYFSEKEAYAPPEQPLSMDELAAEVKRTDKKGKPENSAAFRESMFQKSCRFGAPADMLALYDEVKDNNLSTMWHIYALGAYNFLGDTQKAREVVLRMAAQRLWYVAAPTQVRPMELFAHPSAFAFLRDKQDLRDIADAATTQTI